MDGNEIAKDDLDDEEIPQPQTNKETTLSFLVVASSCYFTWSKNIPNKQMEQKIADPPLLPAPMMMSSAGFGDEGDLPHERFRGSRLPSCWGCRCQLFFVSLRSILCTPENFDTWNPKMEICWKMMFLFDFDFCLGRFFNST